MRSAFLPWAGAVLLAVAWAVPACELYKTGPGVGDDPTATDPGVSQDPEPDPRDYDDNPDAGWPQDGGQEQGKAGKGGKEGQKQGGQIAAVQGTGQPVSAKAMPKQAGVMVFLWHKGGQQHEPGSLVPTLGLYDSDDADVQRKHVQLWKDAGISFVAGSWWGVSNNRWNQHVDDAFRGYLQRCNEAGLQMCVYFEEIPGGLQPNLERIREYAKSPGYYHLFGKPVLFVYDRVSRKLTQQQLLDLGKEFFCVYTGPPVERVPEGLGFGAHWFKIPFIREDVLKDRYASVARRDDAVLFPLIYHGYDNSATRAAQKGGGKKWPPQGSNVQWFQHQLDLALAAHTRVLMFPWNELGEHSAFEPTKEFGTKYYDAMKDAVQKFLHAP